MKNAPVLGILLAAFVGGGIFLLTPDTDPSGSNSSLSVASASAASDIVRIWKSPTCGCCSEWAEHLRASGFTVEVIDVEDVDDVKRQMGVPEPLWSCHTASVGGYVIEGHVPAADIRRLLGERPDVAGLAVAGMPVGSPGMEVGNRSDPYDVEVFTSDGAVAVYSEH